MTCLYTTLLAQSEVKRIHRCHLESERAPGTFEFYIPTPRNHQERLFWRYPDQFSRNSSGAAYQWNPRLELTLRFQGQEARSVLNPGRLWIRMRGATETEWRLRYLDPRAVRLLPPPLPGSDVVIVIEAVDGSNPDYRVLLLDRTADGYEILRPRDFKAEYRSGAAAV